MTQTQDLIRTYWEDARASFDATLVVMAKKAKCIPSTGSPASWVSAARKHESREPKREAAKQLRALWAICEAGRQLIQLHEELVDGLEKVELDEHMGMVLSSVEAPVLEAHRELRHGYEFGRAVLYGYLTALHDVGARRVACGAAGRRKVGDLTRERVIIEAELYRDKPRETAAALIAEKVGKSTSQVKRILLEVFPRGEWSKSRDLP